MLLADYTRRELLSLLVQPKEDVYRGWITWGPAVGETKEDRLERQRKLFEGEWREAIHQDGRLYFYHTSTHETRWDPPAEGLYSRRRFALTHYLETRDADNALLESSKEKTTAETLPSSSTTTNST
jgi:WW domain